MTATINLPKIMQFGAGAINALPDTLVSLGCQYPFIITDSTMVALGYTDKITELLSAQGIRYGIFSDTMAEPSEDSILPAVELVRQDKYDCLLALGGGSAIDTAKAIALLATHGGTMRDYKMPNPVNIRCMPVIAIPTTAGTGSEATQATIITDAKTDEKMLCMGPGLMPMAAIVDYELTLSLPLRIAADTGIDALTHAIEAYVSRKANLFSDQQAIAAMKLIGQNLLTTCQDAKDLAAREAVMLGATLAGIAFSNASVALVHGMSRPLGVHFHVPHGLSNAMLLPTVTEYSIASAPQRYAQCALHMGLIDNIEDEKLAHSALLKQLRLINLTLKVPSLAEFGVQKEMFFNALPLMAEQALASGSPNNNPRLVSKEEIIALYRTAWAGE